MTEVNIWGNRVSPPAVSLSNRTPACGAPAAPTSGWEMGKPGFPIPPLRGGKPSPPGGIREGAALPRLRAEGRGETRLPRAAMVLREGRTLSTPL